MTRPLQKPYVAYVIVWNYINTDNPDILKIELALTSAYALFTSNNFDLIIIASG